MTRGELEQRFDRLLVSYGPSLARLAASYARRASEQDDLFQEVAFAIWRALPGFRGECSERTFVFRIAHNRGISYRARRRTPVEAADESPGNGRTSENDGHGHSREKAQSHPPDVAIDAAPYVRRHRVPRLPLMAPSVEFRIECHSVSPVSAASAWRA